MWLCGVYECVHLCWKKQVLLCESLFVEDRIGIVNKDQFLIVRLFSLHGTLPCCDPGEALTVVKGQ